MERHSIDNIKKGYAESSGAILKLRGVSYYRDCISSAVPFLDPVEKQIYYRNSYTYSKSEERCHFGGSIPWVAFDEKSDDVELKFKSSFKIYVNDTFSAPPPEGNVIYDSLIILDKDLIFMLETHEPGQLTISKNGSLIEVDMHKESIQTDQRDLLSDL